MRRAALALGAVLVVGAAMWAGHRAHEATLARDGGVAVPADEASAPSSAAARTLAAAGTPADEPPEPGLAATRTIPERLPDFTLHDRSGRATPIGTWRGRSLIINFWATWCAPCRREMPLLQALDRERAPQGFQVVGIAVDHPDAVAAFADSLHIGYPLLVGEEDALDVATSLGVTAPAFPFTVFTDRRGRIVALYFGELHKAEADLILSTVRQVDDGRMLLADARPTIADGLAKLR